MFGATAAPTFDQVHRLRYVRQILDETLRLWPTAPGFNRTPFEDTVIGGKYAVAAGTAITVISQALHHSTEVWGPDAKEFNPDHTAAERMTAIPPNAYKPFGTGQRACIGRQFAIQEAVLVLGMLVQRFDFVDHLDYQLKTKTTLTVKPDELFIQVQPRPGFQLDRTERRCRAGSFAARGRARAARRPARHPARRAVRLEPRHGRDHRHPTRAGGHRTRVRRHPGGARRARRATSRGRRRCSWCARRTTARRPTTPPSSATGCRSAPTRARASSTACSAAAAPSGRRPTRPCPTLIDDGLAAHGATPHPRRAARATRRGDFDAAYRDWHDGALGRRRGRARAARPSVGRPRPRRARASRSR